MSEEKQKEATGQEPVTIVTEKVDVEDAASEKQLHEEAVVAEGPAGQRVAVASVEDAAAEVEGKPGVIDNLGDVAALVTDATSKAADSAKIAAGQVGQNARQAASLTAEAAKRVRDAAVDAAMSAGAQAAERAGQNQARAESEFVEEVAIDSSREFLLQEWREFLVNHKCTALYGIVGLVIGILILVVGFWPVLLVVVTTYLGIAYGRYRDGDPRMTKFLARHFLDDDEAEDD